MQGYIRYEVARINKSTWYLVCLKNLVIDLVHKKNDKQVSSMVVIEKHGILAICFQCLLTVLCYTRY